MSKSAFGIGFADDALYFAGGTNGHGGLVDNDCVALQVAGNLFSGGVDVLQVGVAVSPAGRRADGDEDQVRVRH